MWKRDGFNGGIADPCIIYWPAGIEAKGEIREQYHHAIDLVPTILDALGVEPPETIGGHVQSHIDGIACATASTVRRCPAPARRSSEEDVEEIGKALEPGSIAAVISHENSWAGPFASSIRRAGGQLVANGRIPTQALLAAIEAEEQTDKQGA